MKVLLPCILGGAYVWDETPVHIHSKTENKASKNAMVQEADDSVACIGDLAGVKRDRQNVHFAF